MEIPQTIIDKFWGNVKRSQRCWEWIAGQTDDGYGAWSWKLDDGRRFMRAHRFAYLVIKGLIPKPELHHTCENKLCVNPDHLQPVTRKEHLHLTPGSWAFEHSRRTHCPKGHEYTEENCVKSQLKKGHRVCRTCMIAAGRKWREANPEKMKAAVASWNNRNRERRLAYDRERHRRAREKRTLMSNTAPELAVTNGN